jgi:hypothetical protein
MDKKNNVINLVIVFSLMMIYCQNSFSQKQGTLQQGKTIPFSGLKYADVGVKTKKGTPSFTKDELKIIAGGADIWGKHDEFHFAYKKLKGDFDLSVQITGLTKANLYTKAGIMARVDMSDSCQHVYFQVFPDNSPRNNNKGGCEFQYRTEKGKEMKAIYPVQETAGKQFDVAFPNTWIRLKRSGDVFESYFSNDNKSWKLYSTFTLIMPDELFVGLAVTSHNADDYTNAEFKSLKLKK